MTVYVSIGEGPVFQRLEKVRELGSRRPSKTAPLGQLSVSSQIRRVFILKEAAFC
jgi:hypothetical protein